MSIILVNLCSLSFNPFGKVTLEFRVSYSIRFRMLIIWNKGIKQDPFKAVVTKSVRSTENRQKVLTWETLDKLYYLLSITLTSKMANVYNYFKNLSNDNYLINSRLLRCRTAKGYSAGFSRVSHIKFEAYKFCLLTESSLVLKIKNDWLILIF